MKRFQLILVALVFLVNLAIARPVWADAPKLTLSPDYAEGDANFDRLAASERRTRSSWL